MSEARGLLARALAACAVATLVAAPLMAEKPTAADRELLAASDLSKRLPGSFRAAIEIEPQAGAGAGQVVDLELWRKGDLALVRFLGERDRGKFFLVRPEGVWLETPGAAKAVRLDPSHRLAGSVSFDELLGLEVTEHYRLEDVRRHRNGLVELLLVATTDRVAYERVRYVVRSDTRRPVRVDLLTPSGKRARMMEIPEWLGERPSTLVVHDLIRKGPPIAVRFVEVEAREVPDGLFSLEDRSARQRLE